MNTRNNNNNELMAFISAENGKLSKSFEFSMSQINHKLDALQSNFNEIKSNVSTLSTKVDDHIQSTANKFECYDLKLNKLAKENYHLKSYIENTERVRRLADISIEGIPLVASTTNVDQLVIAICKHFGMEIGAKDITSCFRILHGNKNSSDTITKPPSIVVKFSTITMKERLMEKYFGRNMALKLSDICPDLNIHTRIYLGEHLTKTMQYISRRCAALKKSNKIGKFYSRKGYIYIHISSNGEFIKISSIDKFNEFLADLNREPTGDN